MVAVDVVVGRRGAWMRARFGTPRSTLEAISGSLSGAREAEVQEERRLQYVAVGGVVIEGGPLARYDRPWQEWGSGGPVGGRDASGKGCEVQKPLGELLDRAFSPLRA